MTLARRLFRWTLLAYPADFRRRFGPEMEALFDDLHARARRSGGRGAATSVTMRALADSLASGVRAHRQAAAAERARRASSGASVGASRGGLAFGLAQDVRFALRLLRREPGFSAVAVATLALAVGAGTAVFGVVNAYLIRPLPFPEPDRLAWVIAGPTRDSFERGIRPPDDLSALDLSSLGDVFAETAAWDLDGFTLASTERPEYVDGAWVSGGFFRTVGVRPAMGRTFTDEESATGAPVAVISYALWQRRFGGDPDVLGRAVTAYSTDRPREAVTFTVVGVLPREFWYFNRFTDVLVPLRGPRAVSLARLRAGVSLAEAERRLNVVARRQFPNADPAWGMSLAGAQDEHSYRVRPTLVVLLAGVGLVMLIACANVGGLLLARTARRRSELSLRAALGAGRARLIRQLLAESAMLAAAAAVLGTLFASIGLRTVGAAVAARLPVEVPGGVGMLRPDATVLAASLGASTLMLLLFGLAPALSASRADPAAGLGAGRGNSAGPGRARLRGAMVAAQLAISLVLLAGAGSLLRLTLRLQRIELGFRPAGVLKASLLLPLAQYPDAARRRAFYDELLPRVAALPGVAAASVVSNYPFRATGGWPVAGEGSAVPEAEALAAPHTVGPGYFETVGVRLLRGRLFDARDRADGAPVAVVGAALAERLWPGADPIGRRVRFGGASAAGPWRTVVGVVRDTRKSLAARQLPDSYVPYAQGSHAYMYLVVRTTAADPMLVAPAVQRAVWSVDARQPLADVGALERVVEDASASHRFLSGLLGGFAAFAVALATIGLYTVLAYVVTARRREIAVRVACGARPHDLVRLVLGEALPLVAAGLAAGAGATMLLGRVLAARVEGAEATDPALLAALGALLTAAALAAATIPVRRAMRLEPMPVLRED